MKKIIIVFVSIFMGLSLVSCFPAASEQECEKMCENLLILRADLDRSTAKELVDEVVEDFKKEEKRLRDWMERDLKGWDEELEAKLAEAKSDDEKKKLKAEYEKKKEITKGKHMPGIEELLPKKKQKIQEATAKAKENQDEWDAALSKCKSEAIKEGVTQKVAQCRIAAKSTDEYWNICL